MIVLTCKSCNQSFKVENLKDDILSIACPKCMSTIDVASSKKIVDELRSFTKQPISRFSFNFIFCAFWSLILYVAVIYTQYVFDLKSQTKYVDQLVRCAIESIQSMQIEQEPILHIVETPIKTVENAKKAIEHTDEEFAQSLIVEDDESIEQVDYRKIVAERTFIALVEKTQIEYIMLSNYSNGENTIYASKSNGNIREATVVSLANSEFNSYDRQAFHKKYDFDNGEYVYVQFLYVFDYMTYLTFFILYVFLVFVIYTAIFFVFRRLHIQQTQNR